jgi:hemerythrin-like domain-containing protein
MACHVLLKRDAATEFGPATADLRHEHQVILRAVALLERAGEGLAAGTVVNEPALAELVGLIRTLADTCHHGKEEQELFPVLRAKAVGDVLEPFLAEHDEGRGYLRTLAAPGPAPARAAAARRYVGMLRDHIAREDGVLFPMADAVLSADEQAELARRYAGVEERVVGPGGHERLLATLDRLEAAIPAAPAGPPR